MSIATTTPAIAKTTCDDVIKSCDTALAAKNKQLELSDLAIKDCTKRVGELDVQVQDLNDSKNAWYHNPLLTIAFGVAVGVVLGKTVIFK